MKTPIEIDTLYIDTPVVVAGINRHDTLQPGDMKRLGIRGWIVPCGYLMKGPEGATVLAHSAVRGAGVMDKDVRPEAFCEQAIGAEVVDIARGPGRPRKSI